MNKSKNKLILIKLIIITATIPFWISCGQKTSQTQLNTLSSDVIIGDLKWADVAMLSPNDFIRQNSRFVGEIIIPEKNARCTGFLIAENIVMTNWHCIPDASYTTGIQVTFDHETGITRENRVYYKCDQFIDSNPELDFALIECSGHPGNTYGVAKLSDKKAQINESIYVIEQNCDYYTSRDCDWSKKYAFGIIEAFNEKGDLDHTADTLPGSSGSPLFSTKNHLVIGIHHVGSSQMNINRNVTRNGRGTKNYAIPMSKILPYLKSHHAYLSL